MNKEETRILSYLSDSLGSGGSIQQMHRAINKKYGPAYYSNIYNATKKLEKRGIILMEPEGKSQIIRLDRSNPISTYYMSEIESIKAQRPIRQLDKMIGDILGLAGGRFGIISICALEPEKYAKINRIQLLILTRHGEDMHGLITSLLEMESMHNTKIDPIILTDGEFIGMMQGDELNPLKDLILDKSILYNADGFWEIIRGHRIDAKYKILGKSLHDLTRAELAHNYTRFGYELQESASSADDISIEPIIFSMSINEGARIRQGAIILCHKNIKRINFPILYYLFKRYGELGKLKGILNALIKLGGHDIRIIKTLIDTIPDKEDGGYSGETLKKNIELYG